MVYQYPMVTISIPRKVTTNLNVRQQDGGPNVQLVFKNPVLGPQKDCRLNWTGLKKGQTVVAVQALW